MGIPADYQIFNNIPIIVWPDTIKDKYSCENKRCQLFLGGIMKIAIGSIDGEKLQIGHFGMSPFFMLYEITEKGNAKFLEKMINPMSDPKLHKHADTKDIMRLLPHIDVFIGKRMGKESKINIKTKFNKTAITYEDLDNVENALNRFLQEGLRK